MRCLYIYIYIYIYIYVYICILSNLPGGPAIGLGKIGGLIPGSNGELPGICDIMGVGRTGRRGL
jgi:hypothetical protein